MKEPVSIFAFLGGGCGGCGSAIETCTVLGNVWLELWNSSRVMLEERSSLPARRQHRPWDSPAGCVGLLAAESEDAKCPVLGVGSAREAE